MSAMLGSNVDYEVQMDQILKDVETRKSVDKRKAQLSSINDSGEEDSENSKVHSRMARSINKHKSTKSVHRSSLMISPDGPGGNSETRKSMKDKSSLKFKEDDSIQLKINQQKGKNLNSSRLNEQTPDQTSMQQDLTQTLEPQKPKKQKKIEFTQEYINYLNQVYEDGKTQKNTNQDDQQDLPKTCLGKLKATLCPCCSKKSGEQDEENDDWSVILTPVFSSGESDEETKEVFISLDPLSQKARVSELWRKLHLKANGGAKIVRRFAELSDDITMYGASKKIDLDIEEEIIPLPIILLPDNKFKMMWNFIIMFLLFYTATFVPYRTSFIDEAPPELQAFEWIVDALFMCDLLITFISAYEDRDKRIEVRLKFIAFNYLKSWFFLDLAACVPFQLLESSPTDTTTSTDTTDQTTTNGNPSAPQSGGGGGGSKSAKINKLIRLARLPRLYRLLRILRLIKIFSMIKQNASFKKFQEAMKVNAGIQRMITVAFGVLFMVHLMACMWFLVAKFNDFDDQSWVVQAGILDKSGPYQYLTSVYWALQTLTTVGFGDIHAYSVSEKIAALIWMILGVGFYSFTIGNLSSIINTIDVKAAHLQQKLNILTEFAKRTKLPEDVQNRIKRFLENNHNEHLSLFDQKQLLTEIPASLRNEVVSHTHGEIIKKIKFFNDKDPHFLFSILPLLKPMKVYQKDILYNQGDYAEEVFFILKGRVKMYYDVNEGADNRAMMVPFNLYVEGSYFGDSEIFTSDDRNARDCTAIAETECQLLVITRKELIELLKRFKKTIGVEMKEIAVERKKHHERGIRQIVERHKTRQTNTEGAYIMSSQGVQQSKNQDLENRKIIFNKYVKGKGLKKNKESMKNELLQLFQNVENQNNGDKTGKASLKESMTNKNADGALDTGDFGTKTKGLFSMLKEITGQKKTSDESGYQQMTFNDVASHAQKETQNLILVQNPDRIDEKDELQHQGSTDIMIQPLTDTPKIYGETLLKPAVAQIVVGNLSNRSHLFKDNDNSKKDLDATEPMASPRYKPQVKTSNKDLQQSDNLNSRALVNKNRRLSKSRGKDKKDRDDSISNSSSNSQISESDSLSDESNNKQRKAMKKINSEFDDASEDSHWLQNEQIFASFQENMALIAGNSFEILQLYEMISKDYARINNSIGEMEEHNEMVEQRSKGLEQKLEGLIQLI